VGAFKLILGNKVAKGLFWVCQIQVLGFEVAMLLLATGVYYWGMKGHVFYGWDQFGYFHVIIRP
jgi:hypothetical protein